MNDADERECDGCHRAGAPSAHHRCAVCRGMFCEDCTNFPWEDGGPCVECEAKAPRAAAVEYAPMDNGTLRVTPTASAQRRWVSCAGCGRPFWLASGEPIGPHPITDDPRLARPCTTPQPAPAVK